MLSHPVRALSLFGVSALSLALAAGCSFDSGSDQVTGPNNPPPSGELGTGELVAHVGEFLQTLVGRDLHYGELESIYSIEDRANGRLVHVSLAPGEPDFQDVDVPSDVQTLVVHEGTFYWHDQSSFYWLPIAGGSVQSVSTSGFVIQSLPLPASPYLYFDDFVTDRLYRIPMSGGTPEEVDVFTLGGSRSLARDENNLYWIGATDGTQLKMMPLAGGAPSTLLSGDAVFSPRNMKAVPDGSGGTTLYWMDTASTGNPVIRKFPVPGGPVQSILSAANMLDFAVTDEAIYWWIPDYIGRWDLAARSDAYPVQATGSITRAVTVVGDYIYFSVSDGFVYRAMR